MQYGTKAPYDDSDGVAQFAAKFVEHPSAHQHADAIGHLEGRHDIAIVSLRPSQIVLDVRLQQTNDLTVDIVDGCGKEDQCHYRPSDSCGLHALKSF